MSLFQGIIKNPLFCKYERCIEKKSIFILFYFYHLLVKGHKKGHHTNMSQEAIYDSPLAGTIVPLSIAPHTVLAHLECHESFVKMLFIDFNSVLSTIVLDLLVCNFSPSVISSLGPDLAPSSSHPSPIAPVHHRVF